MNWRKGETVRAFVPGAFGVVKEATVVSVGRKYLHLDFGLLGVKRVPFRDVVR